MGIIANIKGPAGTCTCPNSAGGAALSTPTPPMLDMFDGTGASNLTAHTSDSGHTWSSKSTGGGVVGIDGQFGVYVKTTDSSGGNIVVPSWVPTNNSYWVAATFIPRDTTNSQPGLVIRLNANGSTYDWYELQWNQFLGSFTLNRFVAGALSSGSLSGAQTFTIAKTAGIPVTMVLTMTGSLIRVYANGSLVMKVTDGSPLTAKGSPGIRLTGSIAQTTGTHITNFQADNI